jgi:hypothetical protein
MPKHQNAEDGNKSVKLLLLFFACPNGDCANFNRFGADNLSVAEWMGKDRAIRWLYCKNRGNFAGFRSYQALSSLQETGQKKAAETQATDKFAFWCSQEASRPARQTAASIDQSHVWLEEGY